MYNYVTYKTADMAVGTQFISEAERVHIVAARTDSKGMHVSLTATTKYMHGKVHNAQRLLAVRADAPSRVVLHPHS